MRDRCMEERDVLNALTDSIIGAAIAVHRELGPGMLESAYETGLAMEFAALGLDFDRQRALPFVYRGIKVDKGYRIDFLVEQKVVVEIKAIGRTERVHNAGPFVFEADGM
jgi:GxxExxY protein